MQDAGCRMQDPGCRMQDAGCRMQDPGSRMQDPGCRMQDPGCRIQDAGGRGQSQGASGIQTQGPRNRPVCALHRHVSTTKPHDRRRLLRPCTNRARPVAPFVSPSQQPSPRNLGCCDGETDGGDPRLLSWSYRLVRGACKGHRLDIETMCANHTPFTDTPRRWLAPHDPVTCIPHQKR